MTKLTIVLNTYNMQREVPRTLRSMVPPLQRGVSAQDYEVIVIDNGAQVPLSLEGIDCGGVDVHLWRLPPESSHASPVVAINACIAEQVETQFVMVCIDGARMFSPYLVRRTLDVLRANPAAFTYVSSRHLGPQIQSKSVKNGYNQTAEDELLSTIAWEQDLDHLHEISVWAGAQCHNNAFYQNESNALGLSRALWTDMGGYNQGFQRSGGGLCNHDLFKRLVERPNAQNVLLWGETTFHQIHGGAATSHAGYFTASLAEYKSAVGAENARPRYDFFVDKGLKYQRDMAVGKFYDP